MKILMIEWVSNSEVKLTKEWEPIDGIKDPEMASTFSIGFEVSNTENYITLAPNINSFGEEDCSSLGAITILKSSIIESVEMKAESGDKTNNGESKTESSK